MIVPELATVDDIFEWLDKLPAADQIRICRLLADTRTAGALAQRSDALIHAATRPPGSVDVVMQATGLSRRAINKAINNHNRRARADVPRVR